MDLISPIRRANGRRASLVDGFEAYDDAVAALRLMDLWKEEASDADKAWIAWRVVFVDPEEAQKEGFGLLVKAAWELYGIDLDGAHAAECGAKRLIDWEGDSARIAASIRQAYGITWERFARETGFRDACAMIGLLPRDTPMGTAIYYRVAEPPASNGRNSEQIEAFKKLKREYAIKDDSAESAANDAMTGFLKGFAG